MSDKLIAYARRVEDDGYLPVIKTANDDGVVLETYSTPMSRDAALKLAQDFLDRHKEWLR